MGRFFVPLPKNTMSRKKNMKISEKGWPFVPATLKENNWKWHIEYWVWNPNSEKLVRRRVFNLLGNSDSERRSNAQSKCFEINSFLQSGHVAEKPLHPSEKKRPIFTTLEAFSKICKEKYNEAGEGYGDQYSSFLNVFKLWATSSKVEMKRIDAFNRSDCLDFLGWLQKERKIGPKTRNNYLINLNAILSRMMERDMIQNHPGRGIKKLNAPRGKNIPFREQDQIEIEAYLKNNYPKLYKFTRFVYYGFIRPKEVVKLKILHVDRKRGVILVRSENTKKRELLPVVITSQLGEIIDSMNLDRYPSSHYIFSTGLEPGTKRISRKTVTYRHTKALKECGHYSKESNLYSWKHTGNCNAYKNGVDIRALQQQNRHSSLATTELYLRSMGLRIHENLKEIRW